VAQSPTHRLGQIIGDVLEEALREPLREVAGNFASKTDAISFL